MRMLIWVLLGKRVISLIKRVWGKEAGYKSHFAPLLNVFQLPQGKSLNFLSL